MRLLKTGKLMSVREERWTNRKDKISMISMDKLKKGMNGVTIEKRRTTWLDFNVNIKDVSILRLRQYASMVESFRMDNSYRL